MNQMGRFETGAPIYESMDCKSVLTETSYKKYVKQLPPDIDLQFYHRI